MVTYTNLEVLSWKINEAKDIFHLRTIHRPCVQQKIHLVAAVETLIYNHCISQLPHYLKCCRPVLLKTL